MQPPIIPHQVGHIHYYYCLIPKNKKAFGIASLISGVEPGLIPQLLLQQSCSCISEYNPHQFGCLLFSSVYTACGAAFWFPNTKIVQKHEIKKRSLGSPQFNGLVWFEMLKFYNPGLILVLSFLMAVSLLFSMGSCLGCFISKVVQ